MSLVRASSLCKSELKSDNDEKSACMNEQVLQWDDLRTVMAVARAGTLSGAGRILGASHATIFRRLGGIESRLGVQLFERSRRGYAPTPAGEDVAATAERIEAEVLGIERRVLGRDLRPSGTVRVTTTDALLSGLLVPLITGFRAAFPEICLEVAVSNQPFSLTKRETDIALRPTLSPPESLVGRRIGTLALAVYGPARAPNDEWIGWDEAMLHPSLARWMTSEGVEGRCRFRANTLTALRDAVRAGLGVTVLPCYLADGDESLERRGDPIAELAIDLWLLIHPDLRRVARIRAFADFVADSLRDRAERLAGTI